MARSRGIKSSARAIATSLLLATPAVVNAACISLQNSSSCPAFSAASVSTDNVTLVGYFPFLAFVSDVGSFDKQLLDYVETTYVRDKYQTQFGCDNVDIKNTTELYARFTITTVCNSIVQNSIYSCELSEEDSEPICADTCAEFASSVALIASADSLCSNPNNDVTNLVRAEFTTCALPTRALSSENCIAGISNEPNDCGFGNSTIGLCSYCASGGLNSTDTCCYSSNAEERCKGVVLPTVIPTMSFATPTATPSNGPDDDGNDGGLSGGAIAGIVIGSLAALALIGALLFFCCLRKRRSKNQQPNNLNQPSPPRTGHSMVHNKPGSSGIDILPGGRIARMSALEGDVPTRGVAGAGSAAALAAGSGYAAGRRKDDSPSFSDFDSPDSTRHGLGAGGVLRPPAHVQRHSSVSSGGSRVDPQSPGSGGALSSLAAGGVASQQSEQLPFFKDYYSQDDIHPGDRVAVLWAYQPRAADEFALERGDMLKVVGIWDDGWATGVMLDERADEWESRRQVQRDSGVSTSSGPKRDSSPPVSGEIKAFPLVCICLPEHWRKTIEGDGSTDAGSTFGLI